MSQDTEKRMSEARHTPGPWATDDANDAPRDVMSHGGRGLVATAYVILRGGEEECPIACANARLIAAAPELLEACKNALEFSDGGYRWLNDMLRAAISKAEGRL